MAFRINTENTLTALNAHRGCAELPPSFGLSGHKTPEQTQPTPQPSPPPRQRQTGSRSAPLRPRSATGRARASQAGAGAQAQPAPARRMRQSTPARRTARRGFPAGPPALHTRPARSAAEGGAHSPCQQLPSGRHLGGPLRGANSPDPRLCRRSLLPGTGQSAWRSAWRRDEAF